MTEAAGSGDGAPSPVRQLRLVVEAEDYDAAVAFYRDVLGLPEQAAFSGGDGARVVILDAGHATLELANPAQKRMIDDVEVGRQVAPRIRVAFEVDDAGATTRRLVSAGATQVAPPTLTPWQSRNARLDAPAALHITVFQELRGPDDVAESVTGAAAAGVAEFEGIALECRDPAALAEFYSRLTGWPVVYADREWYSIGPDGQARLSFQLAPGHEPPMWPDPASSMQFHLHFHVDDLDDGERAALRLGATSFPRQPDRTSVRVLADPAGHPFCLCPRRKRADT